MKVRPQQLFQSTHPRRVWLSIFLFCFFSVFQSTHPRRVWRADATIFWLNRMFQSTHPRRVWLSINAQLTLYGSFNPHTHAGCDQGWATIHGLKIRFNPHTHAGCDAAPKPKQVRKRFQSTHPRRVWPGGTGKDTDCEGFNPHTHAGCDLMLL